jgi:hypothetical protein
VNRRLGNRLQVEEELKNKNNNKKISGVR